MNEKKPITFEMLEDARHTLGLGQKATLEEIKRRYHNLIKKYHPDSPRTKKTDKNEADDAIRRINKAYTVIMSYCSQYRYSFRKEDFERDQEHPSLKSLRQFSKDGIWISE